MIEESVSSNDGFDKQLNGLMNLPLKKSCGPHTLLCEPQILLLQREVTEDKQLRKTLDPELFVRSIFFRQSVYTHFRNFIASTTLCTATT